MDEDRHRATDEEIEIRRTQVLRLRLARLSAAEIAARVGVSAATVSRDLEAIRQHWGDQLGAKFDVAREVSECFAFYDFLEGAAIRELVRLEDRDSTATGSKMRCIWAARAIRAERIELLIAIGLIGHASLNRNNVPRAAEIRDALRIARQEARELISPGERSWGCGTPAAATFPTTSAASTQRKGG